MADRFYGYQYGTSPRKLNTEYTPYRKRYPVEEEPVTTSTRNRSKNTKKSSTVGADKKNTRTNNQRRVEGEIQEKRVPEYARKQVVNNKNKVQRSSRTIVEDDVQEMAQDNKKVKIDLKKRLKIVMFLVAGFSVLFAISYQNSLISESFNRKEQLKKEMEALSKTNQQLEVSIENNLNLNNIEQAAKEKIGMQKLSNNQKIYVNLPKEDYVAPAAEQIVMEDEMNFFQKLLNGFTKSIR